MENLVRVTGKPEDLNGRLDKEIRVYDLLDKLGIVYERVDHEAAFTVDDCPDVDEALGVEICKNLFLCDKKKRYFFLLMMPGKKTFQTKELQPQIGGVRLSFANETYMEEFLDITPGSVSVMGLMNDKDNRVSLLVDKDLIEDEYVGVHPCINTSSLKITTKDLFEKIVPAMGHDYKVVELSS